MNTHWGHAGETCGDVLEGHVATHAWGAAGSHVIGSDGVACCFTVNPATPAWHVRVSERYESHAAIPLVHLHDNRDTGKLPVPVD